MSHRRTPEPSARWSLWTGPPRRVLVVDDDELIIRTVARTLRSAGLTAETTTVPEEAFAIVERDPPHVIVSDLHMPGACGAVVLTRMVTIAPAMMRVMLSADPELVPDVGSLVDARLHALMSKLDMAALAAIVLAQLVGRAESPESPADREALAQLIARAAARPAHENDAHRHRVTSWTARIAADMGCSPDEIAAARLGAILHDVGQVALREAVYGRDRPLQDDERAEIASHADAGARIIGAMPSLRDALPIITMHHERQDGMGCPAKLAGDAIPRGVLAFQVADAYDAMTTGRRHAPARSHAVAIAALRASAGSHHHHDAIAALAAVSEDARRALVAT